MSKDNAKKNTISFFFHFGTRNNVKSNKFFAYIIYVFTFNAKAVVYLSRRAFVKNCCFITSFYFH